MSNISKARRSGGFTLVEIIIVVVIIAIIAALAGPRIIKAFGGSDANDELQNMQQLFGNLKELKGRTGYGANGTSLVAQLASKGALPGAWVYDGTSLTNRWGGAITITSTGPAVQVTSANIPAPACNTLSTRLGGQGVRTTSINGGTAITGEVTSAAASAACGDEDDVAALSWTTSS